MNDDKPLTPDEIRLRATQGIEAIAAAAVARDPSAVNIEYLNAARAALAAPNDDKVSMRLHMAFKATLPLRGRAAARTSPLAT